MKIIIIIYLGIRRGDRVTSVIIPATMAAVAGVYWVQGLYHMYTGTGKLE
jgi:hypothetical protein